MKKLVFTSMALQIIKDQIYKPYEKSVSNYNHNFYFPITAKLTECIDKGDEVTLCILKMTDGASPNGLNHYEENLKKLKDETAEVTNNVGATIIYKEIESDFTETKDAFGKRFMEMFNMLYEDCKIYADITFGSKPSAMLIMNILYFAEKFYDADIDSVIYGRVLYKDEGAYSKLDPTTAKVCDVTVLYLLNNLTSVLNLPNGEAAKKALEAFFTE